MQIDLKKIPFSVPGTYFSVNEFDRTVWSWVEPGLALRSNRSHEGDSGGVIGYLCLHEMSGKTIPYDAYTMPGELTLVSDQAEGIVRFTFDDKGAVRISGRGLGLLLTSAPRRFSEVLRYSNRNWYGSAGTLDCKYLFPSPNGGPQDPDSVLPMFKRILKRAGLPELRFHDCRHTFCKIALANGVDFKTLSAMLGHYSVAFTLDVYGHVTDDMKRDAAEKVSGVLKGAV